MCTLCSKGERGGGSDMMGVLNLLASKFVDVANIKPRHDQAAVVWDLMMKPEGNPLLFLKRCKPGGQRPRNRNGTDADGGSERGRKRFDARRHD